MSAPTVFDALPGIEAPVASISGSIAGIWTEAAAKGRPAPATEDATAMQVNFVLHLGLKTTVDDAVEQFDTAVRFSRRYPCRVVVLCPMYGEDAAPDMRAKIYGECSLGKAKDDTRCCEFVMLSYPRSLRQFLENQVSVCLSTDLPLYYWAHQFASNSGLADYRYLLTRSRRVLIDSAAAPADALQYPWPRPENVRDLAAARLLPVRQGIGQFLSRYPVAKLCDGLRSVRIEHCPALAAEGRVLLQWCRDRLGQCGAGQAEFACAAATESDGLAVQFGYGDRRFFTWRGDFKAARARIEADFGTGRTGLTAAVRLLSPEGALSESMFF